MKRRPLIDVKNSMNKILSSLGCDYEIENISEDFVKLSNGSYLKGATKKKFLQLEKEEIEHQQILVWWFNEDTTEEKRNDFFLQKSKTLHAKGASRGGYSCQEKYGDKIRLILNTGVPWNKGKKGSQTAWNKGLTKENNESIKRMSEKASGESNPMFGVKTSQETKDKLSKKIKALILSGDFTPNVHNSMTHWDATVLGKKFRSSWEAAFWYANQNYEYEKVRIKYNDGVQDRIYITDFHFEGKIFEVGPKCHIENKKFKEQATIQQGYEIEFVGEDQIKEIVSKFTQEDLLNFEENTREKLKHFIS